MEASVSTVLDRLLSVKPDRCLSSEMHSSRRGWVLFSRYPGPYTAMGTEQASDKRVWGIYVSPGGSSAAHPGLGFFLPGEGRRAAPPEEASKPTDLPSSAVFKVVAFF